MVCRIFFGVSVGEELIDTLWNVNTTHGFPATHGFPELIDTLWNVNFSTSVAFSNLPSELIDTLWNVNQVHYLIIHFLFQN